MMSSNDIGRPENTRKILVVRLGAMGDIIHTLPAVASLKRALPQAELTWAIEPRWAPLVEGNPFVDQVFPLAIKEWRENPLSAATRADFRQARRRLRAANYDLAVDFQGLLKSAVVTFLSRAERVIGFHRDEARESLSAAFYSNRVKTGARHVVEKYRRLAWAAAGRPVSEKDDDLVFPLPQGQREASLPPGDFVLASPLAGWGSKQWPLEYYADLAALIFRESGMPLVIDGPPTDEPRLQRIVDAAPAGSCLLHISSLQGLIAATRAARAVVGVDSGPLHLAAAVAKPGVAIFGPTEPERNGPAGQSFRVLRSPQAKTTYKRNDEIDPAMASIRPAEVWENLQTVLSGEKAPARS